ncbi:hypothetical protein E2C01_070430 [Portunus trituberculatus]|uniref:Uncharacterized protein n=1 Tax=Portunus trituberculatus TaxID=210409 RepID=A0A5B7I296_PORTR|nr:hypothetical protein [Portunus trituberculatus]
MIAREGNKREKKQEGKTASKQVGSLQHTRWQKKGETKVEEEEEEEKEEEEEEEEDTSAPCLP